MSECNNTSIHLLGFRLVNKPRKFGHWVELAAHVSKLRLWKFFLNNFPLSRSVSSLKIDIFLLAFIWSFIKQVVISLPLKQMRRMLQEALRHGIIERVLRTVMYLIRYFQGVKCVDRSIDRGIDWLIHLLHISVFQHDQRILSHF